MKKTMQMLLSVFMAMILLCASIIPTYAIDNGSSKASDASELSGISPYLTNCSNATFVFGVIDGEASFAVSYVARESTFVMAKLKVQIQKKYLGLFWRDVGDEWVGYCEDLHGLFSDSISVDSSGTYRANFTLHVVGNTGIVDVLEDTIDCQAS